MNKVYLSVILSSLVELALGSEYSTKFLKPKNLFYYPKVNLSYGENLKAEGRIEILHKGRRLIQRGHTDLLSYSSFNFEGSYRFKENNTLSEKKFLINKAFFKLKTKWDRTWIWIGHKNVSLGHGPVIDSNFSYLPKLSSKLLEYNSDKGVFIKTPLNNRLDFEVSLTAGIGDTFNYENGYLLTGRVGSQSYNKKEYGFFASSFKKNSIINNNIGVEFIYKFKEKFKNINQMVYGKRDISNENSSILMALNNMEYIPVYGWVLSATNIISRDDATIWSSISYLINRFAKIRINSFSKYYATDDKTDKGIYLQACLNCGYIK